MLDTHALLWWLADEPMAVDAYERIGDPRVLVAVSSVSVWEISIKRAVGRLRFEGSLADHLSGAMFEPLPIPLDPGERWCVI